MFLRRRRCRGMYTPKGVVEARWGKSALGTVGFRMSGVEAASAPRPGSSGNKPTTFEDGGLRVAERVVHIEFLVLVESLS